MKRYFIPFFFLLCVSGLLRCAGHQLSARAPEDTPSQNRSSIRFSDTDESQSSFRQQSHAEESFRMTDPVLAERTYFEGSETIGRVGAEPILKRDILHQMKKFAYTEYQAKKEEAQDEETRNLFTDENFPLFCSQFLASEQLYQQILDDHIRKLLFYNDYATTRSKDEIKEQSKRIRDAYDKDYLPQLVKQFHCNNVDEVKEIFEKVLGSSLEEDKQIFVQQTLGESWVDYSLGNGTFNPTLVEQRRWYQAHPEKFTEPDKVRWHRMSVLFSNHPTKDEAMNKIAYMGNALLHARSEEERAEMFEKVALSDSEDICASKGGDSGWNGRNELNSQEIEQVLFSEELPVGTLSRIIEDRFGYTIVLVDERYLNHKNSFAEKQSEIIKMMKKERKEAEENRYYDQLSKKFAIEIYFISPDERHRMTETARRETTSASGRENAY